MRVAKLTNLESWDDIAARGTALLQKGVDFRCDHEELRHAARQAAKAMGMTVKSKWHNRDEEILELTFQKIPGAGQKESKSVFWDRIMDGRSRRLVQDVDFAESIHQFRALAHKAAAHRGKVAIMENTTNGISIYAVRRKPVSAS